MTSKQLKTNSGKQILCGHQINQGGEGAIFEVLGQPQALAKIYHRAASAELDAKLRAMLLHQPQDLRTIAAWPGEILYDPSGKTTGFLMAKFANAKDVHNLYSPKSRKTNFPSADWRFLVHASCNIAKAFGVAHANNCVIGDVNHGSVLVTQNALACLVDCDSFQFTAGGKTHRCVVGSDTYTPPELQGKSLSTVTRTADHDCFGLAVMIFHLLFMGRHPFSGRYSGPDDMPIDRAIREGRFAYSSRASSLKMERPPHTPTISIVGPQMAAMFEKAFALNSARPTAKD